MYISYQSINQSIHQSINQSINHFIIISWHSRIYGAFHVAQTIFMANPSPNCQGLVLRVPPGSGTGTAQTSPPQPAQHRPIGHRGGASRDFHKEGLYGHARERKVGTSPLPYPLHVSKLTTSRETRDNGFPVVAGRSS